MKLIMTAIIPLFAFSTLGAVDLEELKEIAAPYKAAAILSSNKVLVTAGSSTDLEAHKKAGEAVIGSVNGVLIDSNGNKYVVISDDSHTVDVKESKKFAYKITDAPSP